MVIVAALCWVAPARAELPASDPFPDSTERIMGLARVWSKVKFYHPYLAYKNIDWDAALIAAIPNVEAAATVAEYRAAVQGMLGVLGDPATRVVDPPVSSQAPPPTDWLTSPAPGVVELKLGTFSDQLDYVAIAAKVKQITAEAAKSKIIVVDMRGGVRGEGVLEHVIEELLPALPAFDSWPLVRVVEHVGYRNQGEFGSGMYQSAFIIEGDKGPRPSTGTRPSHAVFVVDALSELPPAALALQASGRGTIVAHGVLSPESGVRTVDVELPGKLFGKIRVDEQLWGAVAPDVSISKSQSVEPRVHSLARSLTATPTRLRQKRLISLPEMRLRNDPDYADTEYPSREHRMLAGIRLWAVLDEVFPYRYLIPDWDAALRSALPRLMAAANVDAYRHELRLLAAAARDGHISVQPSTPVGTLGISPFLTRLVEGKLVVVQLRDPDEARKLRVAVGDVIETIAGVPAPTKLAELRKEISGSTDEARDQVTARKVLDGTDGTSVTIGLRGHDEKLRDITVVRAARYRAMARAAATASPWKKLAGDVGYVDLTKLMVPHIAAMFADLQQARAIVFDMRGYPNGTGTPIAARMNTRNPQYAAEARVPLRRWVLNGRRDASVQMPLRLGSRAPDAPLYTGKVVVLIDDRAISQAETLCLHFAEASGATFVGSPTHGANGAATQARLPGGLRLTFSGSELRHADGRQLQKVGIQPDIVVRPTLAGIRAGKDEVLERALAYLANGR